MVFYSKNKENVMNRTISSGAITSVVMALSMQAYAGEKVQLSNQESSDWAEQVNAAIGNKETREAIQNSMVDLVQNVVVDGNQSAVDVSVILQASRADSSGSVGSTGKPRYDNNGIVHCYSNCHKACHGSRNWR